MLGKKFTPLYFIALAHLVACAPPQPAKEVPPEFKKGQMVFHRICSNCHNADALGGLTKAPKLIDAEYLPKVFPDDDIRNTILNGSQSKKMPSQRSRVTAEEITEIVKYLRFSQQAANLQANDDDDDEGTEKKSAHPPAD
jgi:mono/diheme cytochrome c family protein